MVAPTPVTATVKDLMADTVLGLDPKSGMPYSAGNSLYDDDTDSQNYVSSDPFSKLKYDDLRKVHKDQTVFAVSESDFDSIQTYKSVEQLNRARGASIEPIDEAAAKMQLEASEQAKKEAIMKKEYLAKLESMKYQEKNKSILSRFLQLQ